MDRRQLIEIGELVVDDGCIFVFQQAKEEVLAYLVELSKPGGPLDLVQDLYRDVVGAEELL